MIPKCELRRKVKVKVAQSCPILSNPLDSRVHGILQPEYQSGYPFPSPGHFPNPGIEPRSPTLRADSLSAEPPGKEKIKYEIMNMVIHADKKEIQKKIIHHFALESNNHSNDYDYFSHYGFH